MKIVIPREQLWEVVYMLQDQGIPAFKAAKQLGIEHYGALLKAIKRLTGKTTIQLRAEAGKIHQTPEGRHPCGAKMSQVKKCYTQCHLAWKCEAAKAVGVKKDRCGCNIIPDLFGFKLTKREAYY